MKLRLLFVALCILLAFSCVTQAEAESDIYFTCGQEYESAVRGAPVNRLYFYSSGGRYTLFIPAGWDRAALTPCIAEKNAYYVRLDNGEYIPLVNGEPTDVFKADSLTLCNGKKRKLGEVRVMQGSLPALFIQTRDNSLSNIHKSKENREPAELFMMDEAGGAQYEGKLEHLRARGNTTFSYAKKPYQIKLKKKTDLLGMGAAKVWVMLADYLDLTLLRNRITLDMARYVGMRFAVESRSTDLYIDGRYMGVYLLTEKVQIGKSRVNIHDQEDEIEALCDAPPESYPTFTEDMGKGRRIGGYELPAVPEDITGGYILETDKAHRVRQYESCYLFTENGLGLKVAEPEAVGREQLEYLDGIICAFDRAVHSRNGIDIKTGRHYSEMFDIDSMALKFLLEDVSYNFDALTGSQFFYKDRDSADPKFYAGPGWDYDLTYSNATPVIPYNVFLPDASAHHSWYGCLYQFEEFRALTSKLYAERFVPALEILCGMRTPEADSPLRALEDYAAELAPSAAMNFSRWKPGGIKGNNREMGRTNPEALDMLSRYLGYRLDGLNRHYLKP